MIPAELSAAFWLRLIVRFETVRSLKNALTPCELTAHTPKEKLEIVPLRIVIGKAFALAGNPIPIFTHRPNPALPLIVYPFRSTTTGPLTDGEILIAAGFVPEADEFISPVKT